MKTNKDPNGLITQESIMVAPQELNDDASWTLVESKKTRKQNKKERLQHLAQFPPLPKVKDGSVAMSQESASSKRLSTKINLNKIFNGERLANKTPKVITFKNNTKKIKDKDTNMQKEKQNDDEIISISSTETIDDNTTISESTTEHSEDSFITLKTTSESEDDESTKPSVYRNKNLNQRIRERAYSARSIVDSITKLKKVKNTDDPSNTMNQETQLKLHQHKLHQYNNDVIRRNLNRMTYETNYKKSETNHSTDQMRNAHQDILLLKDYKKKIKQSLPNWKTILHPVSSQELFYQEKAITTIKTIDWSPFGPERKKELRRIENSLFYHQMKKNGYAHAWKEAYTRTNNQCNALGIPYKNRMKLYQKEIEYLSLMLHDVLPENYHNEGIYPNDISVSHHHLFFSPDDSINIARKKWYDYLDNDYAFFWDVYSNKLDISNLSIYDITKLNDLNEIIWFINPTGMQYLTETPEIYDTMKSIHRRAKSVENWVHSRHKSYYTWSMFGWRQLPQGYPSYDSAMSLKPIELSCWVPKCFNLDKYMSKDLYFVEKKLTGEEPTWRYKYRPLITEREKERYISPFTFYPKFELYNGVKYGEMIPNYTTYFSSKKIKNKREIFIKLSHMKHRQLYEEAMKSLHNFSTENTKPTPEEKITTDWLLYYDSYTRSYRDPRFTYGKQVFSARYWQDSIMKSEDYPMSFSRTFNGNLTVPEQFQISQVFSTYTTFNVPPDDFDFITVQNFGTIQKVYKLDPYFPTNHNPKYTYLHTKNSNKNPQDKFSSELPTDSSLYLKFSNIYYEGSTDMYKDSTQEKLLNKPSTYVLQDDMNVDCMREEGQKLSGTDSTTEENKNYYSTSNTYEKCPTVQDRENERRTEHVENSANVSKNIF